MMRITIGKNSGQLVKYFTGSLAKDDYYFTGKSTPGYWHGKLKDELGLPNEVSQKAFSKLARNINPGTDKQLTLRNDKNRRSSIEYLFNAPKSVSLVLALSDAQTGKQILNAHRLAVKRAMLEIERDMQTQTRVEGRNKYVTTGNILYARFDHYTSRPVADKDGDQNVIYSDPNLHSHCVVMNCTKFRNRYQAIEGSTIHKTASYYEEIYHSHLSKGLSDLGFDIRRDRKRWEIYSPGMTRRTLEKFSRRTALIEAEAKKRGITSAKEKAKLGAKTRMSKSRLQPDMDLKKLWRSKLTPREMEAIRTAKDRSEQAGDKISPARAINLAMSHVMARKSAVPVKSVMAQAMKFGYGRLTPKQLWAELGRRENIITAQRGYVDYMTTRERLNEERKMIEFASRTKGTRIALNRSYKAKQDFLNDGQRGAIQQILTSQDQVMILAGDAGTGKTTVLKEIKAAIEERGKSVFAYAMSATASRDVLRQNGFKNADTLAAFFKNKERQKQTHGNVIMIDEASMLGAKDMNRLFTIAQKNKARVLLCGDIKQHNAPAYGDALRSLLAHSKLPPAKITAIQRQKPNPQYLRAINALADKRTLLGFDRLNHMGAVIEIADAKKRHAALAKAYLNSVAQNRSALVIAPTHKEGMMINETIRRAMKTRQRIQGEDIPVKIEKPLQFTRAQKQDRAMYEAGMVIQFFQNVKGGFKAGSKFEVTGRDKDQVMVRGLGTTTPPVPLPISATDRFEIYERGQINLTRGDLIRITGNGKTKSGTRIYNGQLYEIERMANNGDMHLKGGKVLPKNYGALTHGYCMTSYASQGKTCDDVYVMQSALSYGASNQKQFYVSASRAKERIKIFTDSKEDLRNAILKSGERMSAVELAQRAAHERRWKMRRARHHQIILETEKTYERAQSISKDKISRSPER